MNKNTDINFDQYNLQKKSRRMNNLHLRYDEKIDEILSINDPYIEENLDENYYFSTKRITSNKDQRDAIVRSQLPYDDNYILKEKPVDVLNVTQSLNIEASIYESKPLIDWSNIEDKSLSIDEISYEEEFNSLKFDIKEYSKSTKDYLIPGTDWKNIEGNDWINVDTIDYNNIKFPKDDNEINITNQLRMDCYNKNNINSPAKTYKEYLDRESKMKTKLYQDIQRQKKTNIAKLTNSKHLNYEEMKIETIKEKQKVHSSLIGPLLDNELFKGRGNEKMDRPINNDLSIPLVANKVNIFAQNYCYSDFCQKMPLTHGISYNKKNAPLDDPVEVVNSLLYYYDDDEYKKIKEERILNFSSANGVVIFKSRFVSSVEDSKVSLPPSSTYKQIFSSKCYTKDVSIKNLCFYISVLGSIRSHYIKTFPTFVAHVTRDNALIHDSRTYNAYSHVSINNFIGTLCAYKILILFYNRIIMDVSPIYFNPISEINNRLYALAKRAFSRQVYITIEILNHNSFTYIEDVLIKERLGEYCPRLPNDSNMEGLICLLLGLSIFFDFRNDGKEVSVCEQILKLNPPCMLSLVDFHAQSTIIFIRRYIVKLREDHITSRQIAHLCHFDPMPNF